MHFIKYFETQDDDEKVLLLTRKHPIVIIVPVVLGCLGYLVGILAIIFNESIFAGMITDDVRPFFVVMASAYFLAINLIIFISWFNYKLHINILTNKNVVDVNQNTPMMRKIAEMRLEDIQDVTGTENGVLQTMLKYGDVDIQTAGTAMNFKFEKVPNPYDVQNKIAEIREFYVEGKVAHHTPQAKNNNHNEQK